MNLYTAGRVFSLAWLLTFTKSFGWLVCRVVGSRKRETSARRVLNILISIFEKQFIVYGFIAKYQKNIIAAIVPQFKIKEQFL